MDQTALLIIIAVFVFVAAVALCIQAGFLYAIYRATTELQRRVTPLLPKVDSLLVSTKDTVDQSRKQIQEITAKTNEILESTKTQLHKVEGVIDEAGSRAKVQFDRVEMVLDDTLSRAHEAVSVVHSGIMRPLREIHGIAAGIRTAIGVMARGGRPHVDQATSDEEMFI